VAAAGPPGDCHFGRTAPCPGSGRRGCGRKPPNERFDTRGELRLAERLKDFLGHLDVV
jgi:hypothetical protein